MKSFSRLTQGHAGDSAKLPFHDALQTTAVYDAPARRRFLEDLCSTCEEPRCVPPLALIVAHPDDESIGAGARLRRWHHGWFVHVTDGAPRNLEDARAAGFSSREAYARARNFELLAALALAGITRNQHHELGFMDQEASFHLADLTRSVVAFLRAHQPHVVITHAYEGGHPDHDATAFVVHAARAILDREHGDAPILVETTGYHAGPRGLNPGEFLPHAAAEERGFLLSPAEREFKQRLFACFRTQAGTLGYFPVGIERFRFAPPYDFSRPPHRGCLFYENYNWGVRGEQWRMLARQAAQDLGLGTIL
jgi:N-acetylglucosamine malate deacetylase 2